ncbi:MAG: polymerase sigma factor [Planctomycetaceae bacterium]|nr:polymerase sigma factor [Planctomycetaceae bacterium]
MSFPNTRLTLIQRLAQGAQDADWHEFMDDYWGPVCRFAQWKGKLSHEDAEDIASQVFEAFLKNRLLERWTEVRSARLRTLMCAVVRNVISNRARVNVAREKVLLEHGGMLDRYLDFAEVEASETPVDQVDEFYAAWVDDLLHSLLDELLIEYNGSGKGDYFRVLYGRLCEQLTLPEIAAALRIKLATAENYLRHMRQTLSNRLQSMVRMHVLRYSPPDCVDDEFSQEWSQLGEFLQRRGGVEEIVRRLYSTNDFATRAFQRAKYSQ